MEESNIPVYKTHIFSNNEEHPFDNTYKVKLKDKKYGTVKIAYIESIEDYMIEANFKKEGKTELYLISPTGEKEIYTISIKKDTYDINKKGK